MEKISGDTEKAASLNPEEKRALLEEIRESIFGAPMQKGLEEEIGDRLRGLGAAALAVRSSATAEDLPGCSFAGQYDTFLGITGLAGCLEAVRKCWASLWTERAFDYRERNGFDHLEVDMAVIVQELIPAEAAGVVFTADPMTGSKGHITVEAVYGLGDTLVSGGAGPDRLVLDRTGLRVVSSDIARKDLGKVAGGDGGVSERVIDPLRVKTSCIEDDMARLLGVWAIWAESAFGAPQDMEWAVHGKKVYFLQARPITALPPKKSWEDRQVWSNVNTGEILPDVVTPATWSLVQIIVFKIFGSIFGRIGLEFGDSPIVGQVAGRAYFNLNTMMGAVRSFPGLRKMDIGQALGGEQGGFNGDRRELQDASIPDEDIPDLDFSLGKVLAKAPSFLAWFYSLSLDKGSAFVAELQAKLARMQGLVLASLGYEELAAEIGYIRDTLTETDAIIGIAARGMYHFMTLDRMCRSWFKDYRGISANRLCCGLEGMHSADAGFELWRLALMACADEDLKTAVLSGIDFETFEDRIAGIEAGAGFLAMWNRFMMEHGHHTRGELELRNSRWVEDPDYVLGVLCSYLRSMDKVDPLAKLRENELVRQELTARCDRLLGNPLKRRLFDYVLLQAQQGLVLRENVKSEAVRGVAVVRRLLLETGGRLAAGGILEDADDVFFLYLDEIEAILLGKSEPDIRGKVRERRKDYEKNLSITPPKVIFGRFDQEDFIADEIDGDAEELTGLAVCPGVVAGPARVMLRSDSGQVRPGEIMIAPFTDPGWTPHFLTAAGIVMDMGGLLSHGSIVAREYGIPTVVNVGPATRIIKTGQVIRVDGNRGIVRIFH
jgi:pyruvate,water dikinase